MLQTIINLSSCKEYVHKISERINKLDVLHMLLFFGLDAFVFKKYAKNRAKSYFDKIHMSISQHKKYE